MAGAATSSRRRSPWAPYLMIAPALIYLAVFFVVPFWSLFRSSLSTSSGNIYLPTVEFAWDWSNYAKAFNLFGDQILRTFVYAVIATVLCLVLGYPLAYVIAFKSGRFKNLMLGLVILPFFVTFLIRTLAWKTILADNGIVVNTLDALGVLKLIDAVASQDWIPGIDTVLVTSEDRLLSTSLAVIGGLTYNWIIFMILPLYVSLDKIDARLIEASKDLYSSSWRSFRKVILPLSMPGVLAGCLLVFIPASGDFINAEYLGSPQTTMIGNVIQNQFLEVKDYPAAAAISMVLIGLILIGVLSYTRALGTEDLV